MFNTDYSVKVYNKEELVSEIFISGSSVSFNNLSNDVMLLPFGVSESVTAEDLDEYYESRCFPRDRINCKQLVRDLGLDCYEPELICRKLHGQQFDDFIWLQFSDEEQVKYQDIKLRD